MKPRTRIGGKTNLSKAPEICLYCDGEGNSKADGRCGFCENGKPLDTQEDWDNSWGGINKRISEYAKKVIRDRLAKDNN